MPELAPVTTATLSHKFCEEELRLCSAGLSVVISLVTLALLSRSGSLEFFRLGEGGLGFIEGVIFFRDMREVRAAQIVSHGRSSAGRIYVRSAATRGNIVNINGAKIDAEPSAAGIIRHAGVHLGPGEQQDTARRRDHANLRVKLHGFFLFGLFAGVFLDELRGILTARAVPFRVVVLRGSIAYRLAPIARMEGHGVFRNDGINGHPPIDLAHGRRVPGIAMGMKGVGDPGLQIIVARGCAHSGDIEKGFVWIDAEFAEDALDAFLGYWVVDEFWFQFSEDAGVPFYWKVVLSRLGFVRLQGLFGHLARKIYKLE